MKSDFKSFVCFSVGLQESVFFFFNKICPDEADIQSYLAVKALWNIIFGSHLIELELSLLTFSFWAAKQNN